MTAVLTWGELRAARADLAEAGRDLLYQFGVGLAFLATVRRDGGPRVHPMCPVIVENGLYALLVPSPKRDDLVSDGRYALHAFPPAANEDAFYVTGRAELRGDATLRSGVVDAFVAERSFDIPRSAFADQLLFELLVEACLLTRTTGHGDPDPQHTVWRAPA